MINPKEVMKGSVVSYEGNIKVIKTIGEYIILDGLKEWIGGSLINPVPLTEDWLVKLSFVKTGVEFYWADPKTYRIIYVNQHKEDRWAVRMSIHGGEPMAIQVVAYVHQIQLLFFAMFSEHIKLPKIK